MAKVTILLPDLGTTPLGTGGDDQRAAFQKLIDDWTALNVAFGIDSVGGIYLGGSVAANLLNDYEEGTFTPELADASVGGNTATVAATGHYTKVGNLVTVYITAPNIDTTGMTAGNDMFIRNLPFVSANNNNAAGAVVMDQVTFIGYVNPTITATQTWMMLKDTRSATNDANLKVSAFVSGSADIAFLTLQYRTV